MVRVKQVTYKSKTPIVTEFDTKDKPKEEGEKPTTEVFKRRKPKHRAGTVVLREIKRYQNSVDIISQKAPFARIIREIGLKVSEEKGLDPMRWTKSAIMTLQNVAENEITRIFQKSNFMANFAGRRTVYPRDMYATLRVDSAYDKLIENYLYELQNATD